MPVPAQFPNATNMRPARAVETRTHMGMMYKESPSLGPSSYGVARMYRGRGVVPFVVKPPVGVSR